MECTIRQSEEVKKKKASSALPECLPNCANAVYKEPKQVSAMRAAIIINRQLRT